jgi:hypothetical protein
MDEVDAEAMGGGRQVPGTRFFSDERSKGPRRRARRAGPNKSFRA